MAENRFHIQIVNIKFIAMFQGQETKKTTKESFVIIESERSFVRCLPTDINDMISKYSFIIIGRITHSNDIRSNI